MLPWKSPWPWNVINLVAPCRVACLFQPQGDLQSNLRILFHMCYEYIMHRLFSLVALSLKLDYQRISVPLQPEVCVYYTL